MFDDDRMYTFWKLGCGMANIYDLFVSIDTGKQEQGVSAVEFSSFQRAWIVDEASKQPFRLKNTENHHHNFEV
jgi:hypothetical protein